MMQILREPQAAEREIANAIAAIDEAVITLQQYRPDSDRYEGVWLHQIMKLRTAMGYCRNVRKTIEQSPKFDALRKES